MTELKLFCDKSIGKIRPMHAVNNGPTGKTSYEGRGNFDTFAALNIPYVRNHDASLSEAYGSQHVVDVHCIFPDFERDADDATAYDFDITDQYMQRIVDAGSEVFYRLGASIEHWVRKYGTLMPTDFNKWADICAHIIMHYNEGWANGLFLNIKYWEIWNEADLDPDDATNKRTWGGTHREFFDLYEIASKKLKARFPSLMIGGPALAHNEAWADEFLGEVKARNMPLDFFSWHVYSTEPKRVRGKAERIKALLVKHGFDDTPSILNEWNYVKKWEEPLYFLKVIKGLKGSSFTSAVMCDMQANTDVDMLMYYDARVEKIWNGLYDSDTLLPIKGYYPFMMFSELYRMENAIKVELDCDHVFACAAMKDGKAALMLTNYTDDDERECDEDITVTLSDFAESGVKVKCFVLDADNDFALKCETELSSGKFGFTAKKYSTYLITFEK